MPSEIEFRARTIASLAGYDPDQLVARIDKNAHYHYLTMGFAPVDIRKLQPMFMKFINEAEKQIKSESAKEGSDSPVASS